MFQTSKDWAYFVLALVAITGCLRTQGPVTTSPGTEGIPATGPKVSDKTSACGGGPGGDAEAIHGLDQEFGQCGRALANFSKTDARKVSARAAIVASGNRILSTGGHVGDTEETLKPAWAAFTSSGLPDANFNGGAFTVEDAPEEEYQFNSMIVVGGKAISVAQLDEGSPFAYFDAREITNGNRPLDFNGGSPVLATFPNDLEGRYYDLKANPLHATGSQHAYFSAGKVFPEGMGGGDRADIILSAFTASGEPSTDFGGAGDGHVTLNLSDWDEVTAMDVATDGKITAAGCTQLPITLSEGVRYQPGLFGFTANGAADSAFGASGVVGLSAPAPYAGGCIDSLARQSDGKILVSGYFHRSSLPPYWSAKDPFVARINSTGSLDTTFGNSGYQIASGINASIATSSSLSITPDGAPVAVFWLNYEIHEPTRNAEIAFFRLNADGSLLASGALVQQSLGSVRATIGRGLRQVDGKTLVPAGAPAEDLTLTKYALYRFL